MIEPATREDGPVIQAISSAVAVFSTEEVNCVGELFADYLEHGGTGDYRFLVYRESAEVLGYACYGPAALTHGAWDFY